MKNINIILRSLFFFVDLVILSCTDNKKGKVEDVRNIEKVPIIEYFIQLAKYGVWGDIVYCFSYNQDQINDEVIKEAIDSALDRGNCQFVYFLQSEIFPEMGWGKKYNGLLDFLLSRWEKIQNVYGSNPFLWAIDQNNYSIVSLLWKREINVNFRDYNGDTLLHLIISKCGTSVVDAVICDFVNFLSRDEINVKNNDGVTPLHLAIWRNSLDVANCLLKNGANINAKCIRGDTSLHWAVFLYNLRMVDFLLKDKRIDINAKNNLGRTPLHFAILGNNPHMVDLLLKDGRIDVNVNDNEGNTPLHFAAFCSDLSVVELLLGIKGIRINSQDNERNTPLYFAYKKGKFDIIDTLIKNGARIPS